MQDGDRCNGVAAAALARHSASSSSGTANDTPVLRETDGDHCRSNQIRREAAMMAQSARIIAAQQAARVAEPLTLNLPLESFFLCFPCHCLSLLSPKEFDWLLDFISSFLRSPTWTTPLNNFIDEVRITRAAEHWRAEGRNHGTESLLCLA